jgi:branched-chain amino acid transport system ATP-binding protein
MVFQDFALFPHLTVQANVAFGLRHLGHEARRARVDEVLQLVGLAHTAKRMPHQLSGGQQQRVALARALAPAPQLLLLDEPSSGLNVEETADMAFWIQDIQKDLGITVLMVEHDMSLVSKVSNRVLAMNQGEVLAVGTAAQVQSHPAVIEAYLGGTLDVSAFRREPTAAT